ncbi:TIGR04104 family putative zinc finger protein [Peribacillus alkalitolerans]|uniref:TIGR04104 family putative zinc finger protein n=1 Tax=Peribacillus alkalitolerans TaxID=1550385 RepID=UPI0013D63CA7
MQKCENCNTQFSWYKIFKSNVWSYKPIECDRCGSEHKITFLGRVTFVSLTIIPMMIFINFLSPFNNIIVSFFIGISILLIGSLLAPFLVKYKKCEIIP